MTNSLAIFDYKNLGSVRTYLDERGDVWFCLNDVCKILAIGNSSDVIRRLRGDGVDTIEVIDSLGRTQEAVFINEPNLYETIFTSRKPEAKEFRYWITSEVLPSIRRTGMYLPQNTEGLMTVAMQTITEGFRRQEEINKRQAKFNEKQLKTNSNLTTRIIHLEDDLYTERMLNLQMAREHTEVVRNSYLSVLGYMKYNGMENMNVDTNHLGRVASKICRERNVEPAKIKDRRFGFVNGYPYEILEEVFEKEIYSGN